MIPINEFGTQQSIDCLDVPGWTFSINRAKPHFFNLSSDDQTTFQGQGSLVILKNGQKVSLRNSDWFWRRRTNKLELKCHVSGLCVVVIYTLTSGNFSVEYLARSTIPSCLDIYHLVSTDLQECIQSSPEQKDELLAFKGWMTRYSEGYSSYQLFKLQSQHRVSLSL